MTAQERLDAFELVDDCLGSQPAVAFVRVLVQLDGATESLQSFGDRSALRRRYHGVTVPLQNQQWRRDLLRDVDRRPSAVPVRRFGQRSDDRVEVVLLEPVR